MQRDACWIKQQRVLRPAISMELVAAAGEECALLEEKVSRSRRIFSNLMMPGFTAPEAAVVLRHEREIFRAG